MDKTEWFERFTDELRTSQGVLKGAANASAIVVEREDNVIAKIDNELFLQGDNALTDLLNTLNSTEDVETLKDYTDMRPTDPFAAVCVAHDLLGFSRAKRLYCAIMRVEIMLRMMFGSTEEMDEVMGKVEEAIKNAE